MEQSKLFVVIAVIALIFTGLSFHLMMLDKKIRSMERKMKDTEELPSLKK